MGIGHDLLRAVPGAQQRLGQSQQLALMTVERCLEGGKASVLAVSPQQLVIACLVKLTRHVRVYDSRPGFLTRVFFDRLEVGLGRVTSDRAM